MSGLTYTVRTTGFFSLYRGLAPTLVGSMPKAGIRFGGNSEIKKVRMVGRSPFFCHRGPGRRRAGGLGAACWFRVFCEIVVRPGLDGVAEREVRGYACLRAQPFSGLEKAARLGVCTCLYQRAR